MKKPLESNARRTTRRRWILRISVFFISVLLIVVGFVQVVLWTDLPKRVVLPIVQRQLGLRVVADSLSTGWLGNTTLRNVRVSLPLSDESFLDAPALRISHRWLGAMLLGSSLRIDAISLQHPTVVIRQDATGQWNVQEAIELMARAAGKKPAAEQAQKSSAPTALPALSIDGAVVRIVDNEGREARIEPLQVSGKAAGPLVYRYDARVENRASAVGEVSPGGLWQHELRLVLDDIDPWIRPFMNDSPAGMHLDAKWRGQREGGIRGRLDLTSLRAGDLSGNGTVHALLSDGRIELRPDALLIKTENELFPEIRAQAGTLRIENQTLVADAIALSTAGGEAQISGVWDRAADSAQLQARWRDLVLGQAVLQSGNLEASVRVPWPGRPKIAASLNSTGRLLDGSEWAGSLVITGEGQDLRNLDWVAKIPELAISAQRKFNISDLTAQLQTQGNVLTLTNLSGGGMQQLSGRGRLDLNNREWWVWLTGSGTPLPDAPAVRFDIDAWGRANYAQVKNFYFRAGDIEAAAFGAYDNALPKPLELDLWFWHLHPEDPQLSSIVRGRLRSEAHVLGTVRPLELDLGGKLFARELVINERPIGDIAAVIDGFVTRDSVKVYTQKLKLLGGEWNIEANWPTDYPAKACEINVAVAQLPLEQVGEILHKPDVKGAADGSFVIVIPQLKRNRIAIHGRIDARDLAARDLKAQSLTATLEVRDGLVHLDPIELAQEDGQISGRAEMALATPTQWQVNATARRWPVNVRQMEGSLLLAGEGTAMVDLRRRDAVGSIALSADVTAHGNSLGTARASLELAGRIIHAREISSNALGGEFSGQASYHADDPLSSTAELNWKNIDAAQLAMIVPGVTDASGRLEGFLRAAPADDPRALGPLKLELGLTGIDARYRSVDFSDARAVAFAATDRLVTQSATIHAAGGTIEFFERISRRPEGSMPAQLLLEFENLSLDQLVHAGAPEAEAMPGRLGGSIRLAGDARQRRDVFGEVVLNLRQSDLANMDAIALLYDAMRVNFGKSQPTGTAIVRARLEQNTLIITDAQFFNRGVEILGDGTIEEIFQLPESPIHATLIGSARPLKDLRLPFLADVDQIFSVLQSNVTAVRVEGTVREPKVRLATFEEISDEMRRILLGEVRPKR